MNENAKTKLVLEYTGTNFVFAFSFILIYLNVCNKGKDGLIE
jgi:hypothetical protein